MSQPELGPRTLLFFNASSFAQTLCSITATWPLNAEQFMATALAEMDSRGSGKLTTPAHLTWLSKYGLKLLVRNARSRMFMRLLVTEMTDLGFILFGDLPETKNLMMDVGPDIYYEAVTKFTDPCDVLLLAAIERHFVQQHCRKTRAPETLLPSAVRAATEIDFFKYAGIFEMRYKSLLTEMCFNAAWTIPPMQQTRGAWFTDETLFLQKISWFAPFLPKLMLHSRIRRIGAVLSGSLLPLCLLNHEIDTNDHDRFQSYVQEVYRNCSIDLFVSGLEDDIEQSVCDALRDASQQQGWCVVRRRDWREDGSEWSMRQRIGRTVYFECTSSAQPLVHLIIMGGGGNLFQAIANQHFPCVRAFWDGQRVFMTASCCIAWLTRFIIDAPLFGSNIDGQRKSKTLVKYAIRGFGFSSTATAGINIPTTIRNWVSESLGRRPLPWHHPLYNPNLWKKAMTFERATALFECAEI